MEKVQELRVPDDSDTSESIKGIYRERCLIAHGEDYTSAINVEKRYHELLDLQGQIGNWLDHNLFEGFEEWRDPS